ncbi:hypothetical protein TNIN_467571 [Trichonephila inaurata madagascariensis]|uniref:Uncharacterized protein n=1 Tax=Trichonephila inaurata madagascariensis TaxID=2747483 RepID=A0A8X6IRM0_9ARAC|nr:hypothetical protein TNIN_467571 [Trichonephila inaurata madagascariensis]
MKPNFELVRDLDSSQMGGIDHDTGDPLSSSVIRMDNPPPNAFRAPFDLLPYGFLCLKTYLEVPLPIQLRES